MKRLFLFSILLAGVIVTVSACDKNDDYNPSLITESLKSFINTSYNDARIVGTDYERGLLKIEIIHEKKENLSDLKKDLEKGNLKLEKLSREKSERRNYSLRITETV